jgi:hypothetical protein
MYYGYYGYPDGYNITSDISVIFNEKIRKFNSSGLVKHILKSYFNDFSMNSGRHN